MQNKIQYVMLGLLLDRPMNGYMIKQTMEISTANFIRPSYGNIYPTLKTLEKKVLFDQPYMVHRIKKQPFTRLPKKVINCLKHGY
jgi:DNA-binding PadR family transcriptional regulator